MVFCEQLCTVQDAIASGRDCFHPHRRVMSFARRATSRPLLRNRVGEEIFIESAGDLSYNSLVLVAVLAFVVPLVTSRIRFMTVPVVVGEILVGIIIGQSGLKLVQPNFSLELLSTLGFTFLMFISGLEIDFGLLQKASSRGKKSDEGSGGAALAPVGEADESAPLWVAVAIFASTLAGAIGVSFGLAAAGLVSSPWLMSLVLSTTSVGIVVPTLKERGLTPTPFGQAVLVSSLVADFGTMALITAVAAVLAGRSPAEVGLIGVLFVAFFVLHRVGATFARANSGLGLSDGTSQIGVRASFMLIFVFVALANGLGIEVILGAFLAGAVVSLLTGSGGQRLRAKLDAIGFGFFIPVFFIMVGVRFDLAALAGSGEALILIPILLIALYALKVVPGLLWVRYFGWKRAIAGGVLTSARISLMIAAAEIGLRLGVISESVNSTIILMAVLTSSLSPVLFAKLVPTPEAERDKALIVGANRTGIILANRLAQRGWDVVLLDRDAERLKQTVNGGVPAGAADGVERQHGDASEPTVLAAAGERCQAIVILTGDDERNATIAGHARELFPAAAVIASAPAPDVAARLTDMGVRAVTPALSTLIVLENIVRHPDLLGLLSEDSSRMRVEDVSLHNSRYAGRFVRELPLPDGVLAINISRAGDRIVPRGRTKLALGDRLTIVGPPEAVAVAAEQLA